MNYTKQFGNQGETAVAVYLEQQGFTIVARNYKQFFGEIDIIAQKDDVVAFVEVKSRHKPSIDPAQCIPISKQRKIAAAAQAYIVDNRIDDKVCRFDVALVDRQNTALKIRYIPNAFVHEDA